MAMHTLYESFQRMQRRGEPVINLAHGWLAGALPSNLKRVAHDAWNDWPQELPHPAGDPQLRDAILDNLRIRPARKVEDVLISPGSRAALSSVLAVTLKPGKPVLLDAAVWPIFQQNIRNLGGIPLPLQSRLQYGRLDPLSLARSLDQQPDIRVFLMASPVPTTAQAHSAAELHGLLEVCAEREVLCILDRIYSRILFDGRSFPSILPGPCLDWCVQIDGLSRARRGTGTLRVGWACGPRDIIEAATRYQENFSGPADRVAQKVALASLRQPEPHLVEELQQGRDQLLQHITKIPGLKPWPVQGTMFCTVDASVWLGRKSLQGKSMETGLDLAELLLNQAGVLVTPGEIPWQEGLLRLSFTPTEEVIAQAVQRIQGCLNSLEQEKTAVSL